MHERQVMGRAAFTKMRAGTADGGVQPGFR
jgi:hypothetical protein